MGVIEAGGVKLDKFHIGNFCPGTVGHGYTVSGGNIRVAGVNVYFTGAASAKEGVSGQESKNAISLSIQNVGSPAPFLPLG